MHVRSWLTEYEQRLLEIKSRVRVAYYDGKGIEAVPQSILDQSTQPQGAAQRVSDTKDQNISEYRTLHQEVQILRGPLD